MSPWLLALIVVGSIVVLAPPAHGAERVPYGVADKPWKQELGNHRVRLRAAEQADAVWAHIPWRRRDREPEKKATLVVDAATGDGPIDAAYEAIGRITGIKLKLTDYSLRALTSGKDAQGEVTIEVTHNGGRLRARGISTDIVEASAKAYLAVVNRILSLGKRHKKKKSTTP